MSKTARIDRQLASLTIPVEGGTLTVRIIQSAAKLQIALAEGAFIDLCGGLQAFVSISQDPPPCRPPRGTAPGRKTQSRRSR